MALVATTPHTVVITSGKTGPNRTIAATTITNVIGVEFDFMTKRLSVTTDSATVMNPLSPPVANSVGSNVKEFDLAVTATVTIVVAAGVWTVTVT